MGLAIEVPSLPLTALAEGCNRITFSPLSNVILASRSFSASTITGDSVVVVVVVAGGAACGKYCSLGLAKNLIGFGGGGGGREEYMGLP